MYNTYTNSALWSIRNRGLYDYSYLLRERSERCPFAVSSSSSRCCCASSRSRCCCCSTSSSSFVKPKVSINPACVLYGLRKSALIQWPPLRSRSFVGRRDRLFHRLLGCEVDEHCCEVSCSSRQSYCVGARRNRSFRLRISEEPHECCDGEGLDDVDALITLLSEEVGNACSSSREKNLSSVRRVEEKKGVKYGGECRRGNVRRIEIVDRTNGRNSRSTMKDKREERDRRERVEREEYQGNGRTEEVKIQDSHECKHCGRSSQLDNDLRSTYKSDTVVSRGETSRKNEEREARPRRTKSSSCSSYYSLSSSGEFESDIEDQEEGVGYHHENERKSDTKLIAVSAKGSQSRTEDSQKHLRRLVDSTNAVSSTSRKQVFELEDNSDQAVSLDMRRRKQYSQTRGRASESRRNREEDTEIHEIHVNDVEMNSQSQKSSSGRRDNSVISVRSDVERENIERSSQQLNQRSQVQYTGEERASEKLRQYKYSSRQGEDTTMLRNSVNEINEQRLQAEERMSKRSAMRQKTEHLSELSEIQNTDIRNTSVSLVENLEDRNMLRNSVHEINKHQLQEEERMSKRTAMRQKTELLSEISEIHNTNIRNTSISLVENRIRNQEVHTSLVSGLHPEVEKQHYYMDQTPSQEMQSSKDSVSVSRISDVISGTESQRTTENRISGQESTKIVRLGEDAKESHGRNDSRKAFRFQGSQENIVGGASSSQSSLSSASQNIIRQLNQDSEEIRNSQTILIPPPSQLVNRGSRRSYQISGAAIQGASDGTSERGHDAVHENPEAETLTNSGSAGELMEIIAHEDALTSAQRLEQSSEHFIGEFVEKAKHEASSSETQGKRIEKLKRQGSRHLSGGSGAKGPSDEMWVTDSTQGTPQSEAVEGIAAGGNAIVKRSGRSLWSVIADIARLKWGQRAGSPGLVAKPAEKSSPDGSVSSATWFSGREHDGSSDDNGKGDKTVLPQEAASPHQLEVGQISSRSQFESSGSMKLRQESGRHEVDISSPSSWKQGGGSTSNRLSSMSGDQSVGVNEERRSFGSPLPETDVTEVPLLLPARSLKRSPAVKEPSGSSPSVASGSQSSQSSQSAGREEGRSPQTAVPAMGSVQNPSLLPGRSLRSPVIQKSPESHLMIVSGNSSSREQEKQQPVSVGPHEETGSTTTDSVLKQRKLQRNRQVVRDRFDEWEEAYILEAERRKIDEIFMREALMEAKKAADMWEVPVGAVLVHDGKIIARGCNLVEELRDSTAHAEMICIQEGSKALRSWRLADTTLYVTLEPCPMCAGAILQARVNTLVWGAPNKLLGADGSWIRLFPGGEGNESEPSDKPPAPVHPFHPKMTIRRGVLESECAETMQQFFQLRRKKKDKTPDKNPDLPASHHHHHPSKLLNKMHQILPFFCL